MSTAAHRSGSAPRPPSQPDPQVVTPSEETQDAQPQGRGSLPLALIGLLMLVGLIASSMNC